MVTTAQEKEIIAQVIQMRTANKKKWAYLIYDTIEEKLSMNMSYESIAKWLSEEGLVISINALKNLIWYHQKKLEKLEQKKKNLNLGKQTPIKPPLLKNEENKSSLDDKSDENLEDLNLRLQRGADQLKKKNLGFDGFDDL